MKSLEEINVVWFKRDLRFADQEAFLNGVQSKEKLLLLYVFEPSVWKDSHYDKRHLDFVKESIYDLNNSLLQKSSKILAVQSEIIPCFEMLRTVYDVKTVYSSQETGLDITYKRDVSFAVYCKETGLHWKEYQSNGVVRGLRNRKRWRKFWYDYMNTPIVSLDWRTADFLSIAEIDKIATKFEQLSMITVAHQFQKGGRKEGLRWKESFLSERLQFYSEFISKPEMARYGCSRLSPYLAWGNLSIREIFQEAKELKKTSPYKRQLNAFLSRLRWQSHFIQKFEQEPRMEFEAVNKGFLNLKQPYNSIFVDCWKEGKTGYPLVDASVRCVVQTGYLNFRMRSMITSFLTHHLFQHFSAGGPWLARQFLDFEPGIHYGQMQMQAGFTGTNTVRIYNPVKNALEHDTDAVFIKKYVPELQKLPTHLAIEPWTITPIEENLYQFKLGTDYPERIVNIAETRKIALQKLYGQRKSTLARSEKERILETHTIRRKD